MPHKVVFAQPAARTFRKLPRDIQRRIDGLASNPRPRGAEKLSGPEDLYRLRAGSHRIVYSVRDRELIVLVVAVGHRHDVYKRLR